MDEAVLGELKLGSIFAEFFPGQTRASDTHNTTVQLMEVMDNSATVPHM
jgi:hypothetical protein